MLRPLQQAPSPHARATRHRRCWVTALTLVLVLVGCTAKAGPPGPTADPGDPTAAATALAQGLSQRDVSTVAFVGTSGQAVNAELAPLVSGMGALKPVVTVAGVDKSGSTATAKLTYAWTFPGVSGAWTYNSQAQLAQEGGVWKTRWQPSIVQPGLNGTNRLSERRDPAARGKILSGDGEAIVKPRPVVRIGIDKTTITADKVGAASARLARLVKVDAKAYTAKVKAAGADDFVEAIVLRADAAERPRNREVYAIPGAAVMSSEQSLAPTRDFARALLGTVGPASKELVDKSNGAVAAGDPVGRSGLQGRYDALLRGTPGVVVRLVEKPAASSPSPGDQPTPTPTPSASPSPAQTLFESKPVAGKDLDTTLSVSLQKLAEKTLATTRPASAIVALRPSTGQVLAAANGPGSDDQQVATLGPYPPGSTFKVVSSLALLRAGLRPTSSVTCPATATVNGKKFKNYDDYPRSQQGRITLKTALAQSCNTAFIGERTKLSDDQLAEAAASLGLGQDYDVGFGSFFGSVPADPSVTGRAAAMIGQGKVLASPLAMASVVASVSAGRTVVPSLVRGTVAKSKAKPLQRSESADLFEMMAAVVSQGSGRVLRGVGGPTIIAKTGTAEYGPKPPFKTHAWMIAAQGDLAVAVFVETGASGSRTAGPLLANFLSAAQ